MRAKSSSLTGEAPLRARFRRRLESRNTPGFTVEHQGRIANRRTPAYVVCARSGLWTRVAV